MFMYIVSRLLTIWFAFLLPAYSTVKALSSSPVPRLDPTLTKWSMYWSVLSVLLAFEYVAEWLISWFPFYWEFKTLLYLYLSLPQTDGSTYIYVNYLQPFCINHRQDIDDTILAMRTNIVQFLRANVVKIRDLVGRTLNTSPPSAPAASTANPFNAPVELAKGLWNAYGAAGHTADTNNHSNDALVARQFLASQSQSSSLNSSQTSTPASSEDIPPSFPVPQHF